MRLRTIAAVAAAVILAVAAASYVAGSSGIAPHRPGLPVRPEGLQLQDVTFEDADGRAVSGWLAGDAAGAGVVVLAHGIRSDRTSMVERARFLVRAGYAVLLFDLQAHGVSEGERITLGYLEGRSLAAAVDFAGGRFEGAPVAVIGVSLGGAAALMAEPPPEFDALVLEAVYSSLEDAVGNRGEIRFGPVGRMLAPLLLWQIPWRLGFHIDEMAPVARIGRVGAPVLIIAGDADRRTTLANTDELFAHAPEPKELLVIEGAAHVDLHRFAAAVYEQTVLAFLDAHMR